MRLWVIFATRLLAVSSLQFLSPAQNPPHMGEWQQGTVGNPRDITPDAMTKGQFAINNRLLPNDTTVLLACKAGDAGKPELELRFLVVPFRGYNPAIVGKSATLYIDSDQYPVSLDSFPTDNMLTFVVMPGADVAKKIALIQHLHTSTLSLSFPLSHLKGSFITNLTEPIAPIATVLSACGVGVASAPGAANEMPAQQSASAAGHSPSRYLVEGFYLGMTQAQASAAAKAAGSVKGLEDTGLGYFKVTTSDIIFDAVQINDIGQVWSYKFHAKNPRHVKSTKVSGPSYDIALKAFGKPTSISDAAVMWGDKANYKAGTATYEWDPEEVPEGDVIATNGQQTTKPQ